MRRIVFLPRPNARLAILGSLHLALQSNTQRGRRVWRFTRLTFTSSRGNRKNSTAKMASAAAQIWATAVHPSATKTRGAVNLVTAAPTLRFKGWLPSASILLAAHLQSFEKANGLICVKFNQGLTL